MTVEATFPLMPDPVTSEEPSTDGVAVGSGLTDATGEALAAKADHCAQAQSRLLDEWKKPRWKAFVCAMVDQLQELENAAHQVFVERILANAVGAQLTGLGEIVGEKQGNRSEAAFRRMIAIRILRNRAKGRAEDIYKILRAGLDTPYSVSIVEEFPAAFRVLIAQGLGTLSLDDFGEVLHAAKAAGVRIDVQDTSTAGLFVWGSEPSSADTDHGWGDETTPATGGDWASVV